MKFFFVASLLLAVGFPTLKTSTEVVKQACPDDMVYIERQNIRFCIDRFEFPNKENEYPASGISAPEAEQLCKDVGKRICSYDEWYQSCIGKSKQKFSYGSYHKSVCNDNKSNWIPPDWSKMSNPLVWKEYVKTLYKADKIGSHPLCKSDEGVYDMLGNVREWTKSPNTQYGYTIPASYWYGDMAHNLSCTYAITNHAASFASYEFGTRCCSNIQ